jgi:hypothetical protein
MPSPTSLEESQPDGSGNDGRRSNATSSDSSSPIPPPVDAEVVLTIQGYTVQPTPRPPPKELVDAQPYIDPTQMYTRWAWLAVAILIAAIVVITSGVTISRKNQDQDAAPLPSLAPTVEPIPLDALQVLEPIFGDVTAMEDSAFQKIAFEWLTMNDTYGLLDDWRTQEWRIIQRYGMAYLYFATGGPGWTEQLNFLSNVSECEWNQIV